MSTTNKPIIWGYFRKPIISGDYYKHVIELIILSLGLFTEGSLHSRITIFVSAITNHEYLYLSCVNYDLKKPNFAFTSHLAPVMV